MLSSRRCQADASTDQPDSCTATEGVEKGSDLRAQAAGPRIAPHARAEIDVKGRDWERLARREILPALGENYAVKRSFIYRRPIEHVLLGVNAVTMYEASRLHFKGVAMPLYQPFDTLASLIPNDLGATDVEDGRLPSGTIDVFLRAVPFLEAHATPELLLADSSWKQPDDVVRLEVEGYSYLLARDEGTARQVLEHALDVETDPNLEWEQEIRSRCRFVLSLMGESLGSALAQLSEWEEQTLAALRLSRD
jgi:hypothetical protein